MSIKERENRYREALRYLDNASVMLRTKANKKDNYYQDAKYVRTASGTAYNGVLLALDTYLRVKGKPIEKKKGSRINVDHYRERLAALDKKLLAKFNTTYNVLHLNGYYEGETSYGVINEGMKAAEEIVEQTKPTIHNS